MSKKNVKVTGKVVLKVTASQLRDKSVDKDKVRGPKQIGQYKDEKVIPIGHLTEDELFKRVKLAQGVLATGKVPKEAKGGSPAVKDATLSKAKGDLTKANKKLKEVTEKLELTEAAFAEQTKKLKETEAKLKDPQAKISSVDPVGKKNTSDEKK